MLQLKFRAVKELETGEQWEKLFIEFWPSYRNWFMSKGAFHTVSTHESVNALKKYMPELIPTFNRLVELASNHAPTAEVERFLSGWMPPAYISGCSQAITTNPPQLVRNYDYHPHLSEGLQIMTRWNKKKVIATSDSLWGVVDGMNDSGLVVSLTFGGSKEVGKGFGIPIILRYVLEFATDISTAVEMLDRVPSHMAYNIGLLDKKGNFKMVELYPGKKNKVLDQPFSTNHQGKINWPEHASFSKTQERYDFIEEMIFNAKTNNTDVLESFLEKPLYNTQFEAGFGTVYTSAYRPDKGVASMIWKENQMTQSFDKFNPTEIQITYKELVKEPAKVSTEKLNANLDTSKYWNYSEGFNWQQFIVEHVPYAEQILQEVKPIDNKEDLERGENPWEQIADFWQKYSDQWIKK